MIRLADLGSFPKPKFADQIGKGVGVAGRSR